MFSFIFLATKQRLKKEFEINKKKNYVRKFGEIIQSSNRPRHMFIIPLKDFHLFKIAESVISFYLKKISNLAILYKWESLIEWWTTILVHHEDLLISRKFGK